MNAFDFISNPFYTQDKIVRTNLFFSFIHCRENHYFVRQLLYFTTQEYNIIRPTPT